MYKRTNSKGTIYIYQSFRLHSGKTSSKVVARLGKVDEIKIKNGWSDDQLMDWIQSEVKRLEAADNDANGKVTLTLNKGE